MNYDELWSGVASPNVSQLICRSKGPRWIGYKSPCYSKWTDDHLPIWHSLGSPAFDGTHGVWNQATSPFHSFPTSAHLAPVPCSLRVSVAPVISWQVASGRTCLIWPDDFMLPDLVEDFPGKQAQHSSTSSRSPKKKCHKLGYGAVSDPG